MKKMNPKQPNNQNKPAPRRATNKSGNNTSNNRGNAASGPKRSVSRSAAIRAQKRNLDDAQRIVNQYSNAALAQGGDKSRRANVIDETPKLKVIGLGGMDGGGSKN